MCTTAHSLTADENSISRLKLASSVHLCRVEQGTIHTRRQERESGLQFCTASEVYLGPVASCSVYMVLDKWLVLSSAAWLCL